MKKLTRVVLAVSLFVPTITYAGSFTGTTSLIRYGDGTETPAARISIEVGTRSTSCPAYPTTFSVEDANAEVVSMWASALLAAQSAGQTVFIQGAGVCDKYGVEIVAYFDIKPKKQR